MSIKNTSPPDFNNLTGGRRINPTLVLQPQKYVNINIILMTIIAFLLLGTQFINQPVPIEKSDLQSKIDLSTRNLEQIEKKCPTILKDHQSCQQKLVQCFQTNQEFKQANQQMMGALKECESVNTENAELTNKINEEIQKMEQTLSQYS